MPLNELLQKACDGGLSACCGRERPAIAEGGRRRGLIGAGRHERAADRLNWRNGYRDRTLDTRLGSLNLKIPKLRAGSYFPPFLEARKTTERRWSPSSRVPDRRVSTRRVDEIAGDGAFPASRRARSRNCARNGRARGRPSRPAARRRLALSVAGCDHLEGARGRRIVSVAAIIAARQHRGTARDRRAAGRPVGSRDLLGGTSQRSTRRGLRRQARDFGHARRLKAAVQRVVGGDMATLSRALHAHVLAYVPKTQETVVAAAIRQAFIHPDSRRWVAGSGATSPINCGPA